MNKIRTAVIPVAGFGTRMLPLSKSVPKELLPLANKPVIQYVIEEAIAAGIKHIVLVTHAQKSAIENYFDLNAELNAQLEAKNKTELLEKVNCLPDDVKITSVRQGKALGLGHAVLCAQPIVGNAPFAVMLPDVVVDPVSSNYKTENLAAMLASFDASGKSQILVEQVADEDVSKYGIADLIERTSEQEIKANHSFPVKGFVEKPKLADAPSNLAVVGRYVFDEAIFSYLKDAKPTVGGEIQLTDAMDKLIESHGVDVLPMSGKSFDAGDMHSYMKTFMLFAERELAK